VFGLGLQYTHKKPSAVVDISSRVVLMILFQGADD